MGPGPGCLGNVTTGTWPRIRSEAEARNMGRICRMAFVKCRRVYQSLRTNHVVHRTTLNVRLFIVVQPLDVG